MRTLRRPKTALAATLLAALAIVIGAPHAAYAGGTVRDDDGEIDTFVDMDYFDDTAQKTLNLPSGIMTGATSATLWVYAQAEACGAIGDSQTLVVNGNTAATFNPCSTWITGAYTWAGINIDPALLFDGAANTFDIWEIAGDWADRNAFYGVDLDNDFGRSYIYQSSGAFTGEISGELMWYLQVVGNPGSPGMSVSPTSISFGSRSVGSTSSPSTVTVSSIGTSSLTISGVSIGGTNAGDFTKSADSCTGATLSVGSTCTFQVTFTPGATGGRTGTATVSGNAGSQVVSLSGSGVFVDTVKPVSQFTTANGAVLLPGGLVLGTVTDNVNVAFEQVTFTPATTLLAPTTLTATLSCNANRTSCSWSVVAPLLPGTYTANARATDAAGNAEFPGPTIQITVL